MLISRQQDPGRQAVAVTAATVGVAVNHLVSVRYDRHLEQLSQMLILFSHGIYAGDCLLTEIVFNTLL